MRARLFFLLFSILALAAFSFSADSNMSISASGGNISAINVSFVQESGRWFAFYGYVNATSGTNGSLVISSGMADNSSDVNRLMNFSVSESGYYMISDDSSPFEGNYSAATTAEIDSHFGLSGHDSSSYVFANTSNFTIYLNSISNLSLALPTIYLAGQNADGSTNATAFRQGVAKRNSSFVFIIPTSDAKGFDGRDIDYEFVLPYSIFSSNQYYVFTVYPLPPATPSSDTGINLPAISLSWAYNGSNLEISTLAGTTLYMYNELGASYSGISDSSGKYSAVAPAGFKYYITASKSGYTPTTISIYIPPPKIIVEKPKNETIANASITKEGELEIFKSAEGTMVCIGEDCYIGNFESPDSVQKLSDLSCSGSICRFVGISDTSFIEKYSLRKAPVSSSYLRQNQPTTLDLGKMFSDFGFELSSGLGSVSRWPEQDSMFFLYVFAFFAIAALFVYVFGKRHPEL